MRQPRPSLNRGFMQRALTWLTPKRLVALLIASWVIWLGASALFRHARKTLSTDPREKELRDGVTMVTHLSLDRMPALRMLMSRWDGDAAIAFFVKNMTQDLPIIEAFERDVVAKHPSKIKYCIFACKDYQYPVNILRNRALQLSETHLSFLLDVDFVPDDGLSDYLQANAKKLRESMKNTVFVVPCFEHMSDPKSIPTTKGDLMKAIESKKTRPMFEGVDEVPHVRSTDYKRWYSATDMYPITYYDRYEPYVVTSTIHVPQYDERFLYYGNDKIQFISALDKAGFSFQAIPMHFVTHYPHPRSEWANNQVKNEQKVQDLLNDFNNKN